VGVKLLDLPQVVAPLPLLVFEAVSEPVGCSVVVVVVVSELAPDFPKFGKKVLTAKKTPTTIAIVISKREKVVSRAIVVILIDCLRSNISSNVGSSTQSFNDF
jgi:hypothetical protein